MDSLLDIIIKTCDLVIQFFSGDEWKKYLNISKL